LVHGPYSTNAVGVVGFPITFTTGFGPEWWPDIQTLALVAFIEKNPHAVLIDASVSSRPRLLVAYISARDAAVELHAAETLSETRGGASWA
jgi:hypothetical protein